MISINAPLSSQPNELYSRLLQAMRYPLANPSRNLLHRVVTQARRLGVVLIHVDDAANPLVGSSSSVRIRAAQRMAASFRELMESEGRFSMIVSGVDATLDILGNDLAFAGRSQTLQFESIPDSDANKVARMIREKAADARLRFEPQEDLILQLLHSARHQFGLTLEMAWRAIAVAVGRRESADGKATLEVADFAEAFRHRTGCSPGLNTFLAADWRRIDTSVEPVRFFPDPSPTKKGASR